MLVEEAFLQICDPTVDLELFHEAGLTKLVSSHQRPLGGAAKSLRVAMASAVLAFRLPR